jgi:hypothetical protein
MSRNALVRLTTLAILLCGMTLLQAATPAGTGHTYGYGDGEFSLRKRVALAHNGDVFSAKEAGCAIRSEGAFAEWTTACVGDNLWGSGSAPVGSPSISTARIAVKHVLSTNPALPDDDTLYVSIGVTGDMNIEPTNDKILLMLDIKHDGSSGTTDDRGVLITRDGVAQKVDAGLNPIGAPSSPNCPSLANLVCAAGPAGQWRFEAKFVPSDFNLPAFAGTVGMIVVATDGSNPTSPTPWPSGATLSNRNTWADLKLGRPVDVVLVFDQSGSMNTQLTTTSCPPSPTFPCTRLGKLKDAAELFLQVFNTVAIPADNIAVRYFATTVTQFPSGGALLPMNTSNVSSVTNDIQLRTASGWTAMGGGLQTAIDALSPPNASRGRAVVLFTDGEQNVDPMVHDPGVGLTIQDEGTPISSGVNGHSTLDMALQIRVNTIGVEGSTTVNDLLSTIATLTGGKFNGTTDPSDFQEIFIGQVVDLLRPNSPQLVAYRRGITRGDKSVEVFTINKTSRKVVFEVSWPRGDSLSFRVKKDGVDVTPIGEIVTGAFYRIFALPLPASIGGNEVAPEGDWELEILGRRGISYETAALSDESSLAYQVSLGHNQYAVGDTLSLGVNVTFAGHPVTDARVTATILKPGLGVGTLLSTNPTPQPPPTFQPEPGATAGQKKLALLLQDQHAWQSIQPGAYTVSLQGHPDGSYSGLFGRTDVEGTYTAQFNIEGERPDIGKYRRTERISTPVRFGKASLPASSVRITELGRTTAGRSLQLYICPKDRFGNNLGPDNSDQVTVVVSPGSVDSGKVDLVDGCYTIPLLIPLAVDPTVTISVMDQPVFHGRLSRLEPRSFALSLHAGVSLPHGTFNAAYDPGFGFTIDGKRQLNSTFAIIGLLGYHRFEGAGANTDLDLYHASAGLEALLTSGRVALLADAGGGVYHFSPGSTDPGAHAGIGLELDVSPAVVLGISYRAHTVFTSGSNTTFSSIQAGARLRF